MGWQYFIAGPLAFIVLERNLNYENTNHLGKNEYSIHSKRDKKRSTIRLCMDNNG